MTTKIILGSKSAGRKRILTEMGYKFSVMVPDVDEKLIRDEDPKKMVLAISQAKTDALLPKIKEPAILITGDQVVLCNGKILEKPKNKNEARKFLKLYAKYPATTINATTVTNTANNKQQSTIDTATIWFRSIPNEIIEEIIEKESALECAGGFSIDGPILQNYVTKIEGTKDSITGLPKELTRKLIAMVA